MAGAEKQTPTPARVTTSHRLMAVAIVALGIGFTIVQFQVADANRTRATELREAARKQAVVLADFSARQATLVCEETQAVRRILRGVLLARLSSPLFRTGEPRLVPVYERYARELAASRCPPPIQPPPIP